MSRGTDEVEFSACFEQHRDELRRLCYRMTASFDESEELVQETFLRAWRNWDRFEARSSVRTWLFRIATNACLDALRAGRRRVLPYDLPTALDDATDLGPDTDLPWLQPLPDADPPGSVSSRETIELVYVAALQHLPPRQRATLILCDVAGWSAAEVAGALDTSVVAVGSAVQRARDTLRARLGHRLDWSRPEAFSAEERQIVARFAEALEHADLTAIAETLIAEARGAMPPYPMVYRGRDELVATLARGFELLGPLRVRPTRANASPALALYRQPPSAPARAAWDAIGLSVLTVADGGIAEVTSFMDPGLVPGFRAPGAVPDGPPMSSPRPVV